ASRPEPWAARPGRASRGTRGAMRRAATPGAARSGPRRRSAGRMARYLQVSSEVAYDVESGALGPGDELPSVREAAHRYKTTGSTISRAYRHLADAGVIDARDRRRSRVAAGGAVAARRLLGGQPALRLAGSDDPGLDTVLRQAGPAVVTVGARGSFHGLTGVCGAPPTLRRSTCDTAPAPTTARSRARSCAAGSPRSSTCGGASRACSHPKATRIMSAAPATCLPCGSPAASSA